MADLKQLISKRKMVIKRVNQLSKLANELSTKPEMIPSFQVRVAYLKDWISQFDDAHSRIESHDDNQATVEELNEILEAFDDDVHFTERMIGIYITPLVTPSQSKPTSTHDHVRLPQIELGTFNGDLASWTSFADLFKTLIDNHPTLSPTEKFHYLKLSLKGEPLDIIKNLPINDANYAVAADLLKKRYDNPRLIVNHHINAILNIQTLTKPSYSSLTNFISVLSENIAALKVLDMPVDSWSYLLVVLITHKLDTSLRNRWEHTLTRNVLPTFPALLHFIETQAAAQEWQAAEGRTTTSMDHPADTLKQSSSTRPSSFKPKPSGAQKSSRSDYGFSSTFFSNNNRTYKCIVCRLDHVLYKCPEFVKLDSNARNNLVNTFNLCSNCLASTHSLKGCPSKHTCRTCNRRHHSLLHYQNEQSAPLSHLRTNKAINGGRAHAQPRQSSSSSLTLVDTPSDDNRAIAQHKSTMNLLSHGVDTTSVHQDQSVTLVTGPSRPTSTVLLATARVQARDANGSWQSVRILLDCASQASYITESCLQRLKLPRQPLRTDIYALGGVKLLSTKGIARCQLRPFEQASPTHCVSAVIIKTITSNLPSAALPAEAFKNLEHLALADPNFRNPGPVDMLLGADIFPNLITGRKQVNPKAPTALETVFGWVVMGEVRTHESTPIQSFHLTSQSDQISTLLKRFWEIEEVSSPTHSYTPDELECETFYKDTVRRTETGRYIVSLPFRIFPPQLGHSYNRALLCHKALQRRLMRKPSLHQDYANFLRDYLESGHMQLAQPSHSQNDESYYIPHHCVLKPESATTKLRVVFNGSQKTSLNISLNEVLFPGPPLQQDLSAILIRFRFHKYIITADIRQMYRQILIDPNHRSYQRILWSFDANQQPDVYELTTVTYGLNCAPYLALRTLHQLVEDEGPQYPLAARVILKDTYVDDVISGCDTLDEAIQLQRELTDLLSTGGFELRKWTSNHPAVLAEVPPSHQQLTDVPLELDRDSTIKVLGLRWSPSSDTFCYQIHVVERDCTKRSILSEISKIFDPLGWLTPLTMTAKQLMQELWTLSMGWDDTPPLHIVTRWNSYQQQLMHVTKVHIPRYVSEPDAVIDLLGFCDASEAGYAGVIYIRSSSPNTSPTISLLYAKSRVAPLKRISLPRLELCAAHLLARMITYVQGILPVPINCVYAWSDSTITLAWIRAPSYRWKTFVSNRVSAIQSIVPAKQWFHVRSADNPADCASRGVLPSEILHHPLWWHGPSWLPTFSDTGTSLRWCSDHPEEIAESISEEAKRTFTTQMDPDTSLLGRYSSLNRLQRITARCFRFFNRCRSPFGISPSVTLTTNELDHALLTWVKLTQAKSFQTEIRCLQKNLTCTGALQRLSPYLDNDGLLRVGGRLRHALVSNDQKHPMLLPSRNRLTHLIINHYHRQYLHPSPRTLQAILERRFWIISARRTIRSITLKCLVCFRCKPTSITPPMGDLPAHRTQQLKPFEAVGVDYGGPFAVTHRRGRGIKPHKAYLCLFVCFSTKALHLEVASDLSTDTFLAAFRRFIARRGRCAHIYSDCGTNFVGAKRYLTEVQAFVRSSSHNDVMSNALLDNGVEWHLNPPAAPHFGGIWEAGIKSVKAHLVRVVGDQILTYEEFTTITAQIEAILNSRPLCALTADPNDLSALTPGHFLVHEPLVGLPEVVPIDMPMNRLTRWQLIQKLQSDFWKRWHTEYLSTLQQRSKWTRSGPAVPDGTLVLLRDPLLPPLQWRLGRVLKTYPGRDHIVRVAQVRTAAGILTRPLVKLCPLPPP